MSFFNQYPYININDLNLDFILNAIKEMRNEVTNFVSINAIKYANPIQWNITSQYEKNTIVIDPLTGTAYISVMPVPSGVALTREEYWTVVFDLGSFVTRAAKNFTTRYEQDTTLTATFNSVAGDWLVWGDTLYIANVNITAGDSYVIDGNIRRITIEEVKNTIVQLIADNYDAIVTMIGDLNDLTTTDKTNIVAAINEVVGNLTTLSSNVGDLNDLNTTDKSSIVNAINESLTSGESFAENSAKNFALLFEASGTSNATISSTIGDWLVIGTTLYIVIAPISIGDAYIVNTNIVKNTMVEIIGTLTNLNTVTKSSIVAAINEVLGTLNTTATTINNTIGDLNNLTTTDKSNVVNAINEVESEIGSINTQKRIIAISDSYGMGRNSTTPWTTFFQQYMGLSSSDYYTWSEGSMGFNRTGDNGHTVQQLLAFHENDVSSPNTITHVVIALGLNDTLALTGLDTAIDSCISYVKTTYPNAKIMIGFIGNFYTKDSTTQEAYFTAIEEYISACGRNGVTYLRGAEYPMHNMQYMQADHIHPTTPGSAAIARFIASYIDGGAAYIEYQDISMTTTNFDAVTHCKQTIANDIVSVVPVFDRCTVALSLSRNIATQIGTLVNPIISGVGGSIHYNLCYLYDGTDYVPAYWYIFAGGLYVVSTKTITVPVGSATNFISGNYPTIEA